MGLFNQMRAAQDMMKNMSPQQIQELMAQAKEAQKTMAEQAKQALDEEIARRGLVSREDVQKMLEEHDHERHQQS